MAKFYRINQFIQSSQLRVLDAESKQIGVFTKQEALDKARELELDLVEIAPNAQPPVAKIIDYKKFKYSESKKERAEKKGNSGGGLKELWLSPRIDTHDLETRIKRASEFLKEGYKVKLTVKFKGRELGHRELGFKVLDEAYKMLGDQGVPEKDPKFEGRNLTVVLTKGHIQHKVIAPETTPQPQASQEITPKKPQTDSSQIPQ